MSLRSSGRETLHLAGLKGRPPETHPLGRRFLKFLRVFNEPDRMTDSPLEAYVRGKRAEQDAVVEEYVAEFNQLEARQKTERRQLYQRQRAERQALRQDYKDKLAEHIVGRKYPYD